MLFYFKEYRSEADGLFLWFEFKNFWFSDDKVSFEYMNLFYYDMILLVIYSIIWNDVGICIRFISTNTMFGKLLKAKKMVDSDAKRNKLLQILFPKNISP